METGAILACGLPAQSRVLRALNSQKIDTDTILNAVIADQLSLLVWFKTKDGHRNRNRPRSYVKMLQGGYEKEEQSEKTFGSGAEFEEARRRLLEGN